MGIDDVSACYSCCLIEVRERESYLLVDDIEVTQPLLHDAEEVLYLVYWRHVNRSENVADIDERSLCVCVALSR